MFVGRDMDRLAERLAERMKGYDVIAVSGLLEQRIQKGSSRKYFRFRGSRFYGGSAVGDVVLCNLRCAFCWTGRPRDDPRLGFYVTPRIAARRLQAIAGLRGYRVMRLSAGEPTLGWRHLVGLLDELEDALGRGERVFVVETNGVLLGAYPSRVEQLKRKGVHVRVSLKACNRHWFKLLTGASERGFELQLRAVEELYSRNVSFHVALFMGFGSKSCWLDLVEELARRTSPRVVADKLEPEALVLYAAARRRLRHLLSKGVKPNPGYTYQP